MCCARPKRWMIVSSSFFFRPGMIESEEEFKIIRGSQSSEADVKENGSGSLIEECWAEIQRNPCRRNFFLANSLEGLSDGGSSGRRPFFVNASKTFNFVQWRDGKNIEIYLPEWQNEMAKKKKTSRRYCSMLAVYFLNILTEPGSTVTHARLFVRGDLLSLIASPDPSQIWSLPRTFLGKQSEESTTPLITLDCICNWRL